MRRFALILLASTLLCGTRPASTAPWEGAADPLSFGHGEKADGRPVPVFGRHGMVVSAQRLASEAGAAILKQGGNAVDAAVATAYALAVVYPAAGNIGGGGFLTLRQPDGQALFLDFREHAPLAATATMYQDAQGNVVKGESLLGWKAVAVPGTVAGMDEALRRWGHLSRAAVMAPAIRMAREGFLLTPGDVMLLDTATEGFRKDPASARIFLRPDGSPLQVGDRLVQRDLADSLTLISREGARAFYDGPIAAKIVSASRAGGGILSAEDFSRYHTRVLPPVTCHYRGYTVDTAPPPSGGGVALCEILNILDGYDLRAVGLRSPAGVQRQVEAMRHAYSDRRDLGDPAFVADPVARLVDPAYAAAVRAALPADRAVESSSLVPLDPAPHAVKAAAAAPDAAEKTQTTHFSVIDKDGRAVSMTYTLNGWFGAQVTAAGTGIVMNDEMDDFSSKPGVPNQFGIVGSAANAIAPGKTPLSSMSPTILSRGNKVVMVIGSPGGSRIPTITLESILAVVDGGRNIADAVNMPRFHEQWMPDIVEAEQDALSPDTVARLQAMGYRIKPHENWGAAEGILVGGPSLSQGGGSHPGYWGGVDLRHPGGGAVGE
ncbi:gamma-glutamyltransferase [Rhizosaccharibacter radicis]|uniref:Glutathione hydrolase proenzyme n=1 Tax=Rhizosaccharibacter radicis TaxID=2782605 RepID=A0ABT1VZ46_9PROT|nr:gamma-glutamyltransferase [Acetobacteraceae bacterium KSS12]